MPSSKDKKMRPEAPLGRGLDRLRKPIALIVSQSRKLLDTGSLSQKEMQSDLKKIHALGTRLLKFFDEAVLAGTKKGKRIEDVLGGLNSQTIHDLRTPLNGIIGYTELVLEEFAERLEESGSLGLQEILTSAKSFLILLDKATVLKEPAANDGEAAPDISDRDKIIEKTLDSISQSIGLEVGAGKVNRGTILVVDDNEINRDLLSSHLTRQGHSVKLAANGREALDKITREPVDLILLDIIMPEMNGFQFLENFRKNPEMEDIPVIVITALDNIDSVIQCIQMGAEDYLLKPFNPVLLTSRINSCLEKKRLIEISRNFAMHNLKKEDHFVAESRVMQNILKTIRTVSRNPVNILLHGNSGTGKELMARLIHDNSDRKGKPFVAVNCAAIPENLMESEFFGYEKGAFTGAVGNRSGYFEEAAGGTLFLDEIGDMPMFVQPKFLRAIEEGEGRRLGSSRTVSYDVRIISATNKDLRQEVEEGRFRKDLFYRIFSVEIRIPPLSERQDDIVPLAMFFLKKTSDRFHKKIAGYSAEILNFFEKYPWPGNVRQLQHEVERLVAFTPEGEQVLLKHCSQELLDWQCTCPADLSGNGATFSLPEKIKELEISCINEALRQTGGKKLPAARLLGITRVGLDNKIKRYGIKIPS